MLSKYPRWKLKISATNQAHTEMSSTLKHHKQNLLVWPGKVNIEMVPRCEFSWHFPSLLWQSLIIIYTHKIVSVTIPHEEIVSTIGRHVMDGLTKTQMAYRKFLWGSFSPSTRYLQRILDWGTAVHENRDFNCEQQIESHMGRFVTHAISPLGSRMGLFQDE